MNIRLLHILRFLFALCLLCPVVVFAADGSGEDNKPTAAYGVIYKKLIPVAYSGTEKFIYDISYTGGVKLGELHLEIRPVIDAPDSYELYALVTTEGSFFNNIYPIHDVHVTKVSGEERLPYHYEVWQEEGKSYRAHRVTEYDQKKGRILYKKNEEKKVEYRVDGKTHNEFSAFFASRLMDFQSGASFLVPTFADKKRVDVEVKVTGKRHFGETSLGLVDTYEITPILKFKGLYDKRGDTVIWYTDDECRIPVQINSKIAIGSLTGVLQSYENPACTVYPAANRQK